MEKTVIICLNPFVSHFIPTIKLAIQMKKLGYRVIYLGFEDLKDAVERENFEYYTINSCRHDELSKLQAQKDYKGLADLYRVLHMEIKDSLKEIQIDIVFIGISRFLIYLPPFLDMKTRVMFYSLCAGIPAISCHYPPTTSDYCPHSGIASRMCCLLEWTRRFMRKGMKPQILLFTLHYPWSEISRKCKKRGIRWKFGIDGFYPEFKVVILGTKYFEFEQNNNYYFTGLCVEKKDNLDMNEKEKLFNFANSNNPIIYCCLGTMSKRYLNAESFIEAVIKLFEKNPQWNLILSLGKKGEVIERKKVASNIHVVDFVHQLDILPYIDLVITHGGHSTIKECIYTGVPILVFPCSYDQHGNAARVQHHKIGIKSNLLKKTWIQKRTLRRKKIIPEDIEPFIEEALTNKVYKKNICDLQKTIVNENELDNFINVL